MPRKTQKVNPGVRRYGSRLAASKFYKIPAVRKIQLPVTAGKSVSAEEVEKYYEERDNTNKSIGLKGAESDAQTKKKGRPLGSKNKKKKKINNDREEEKNKDFDRDQIKNGEAEDTITEKNSDNKSEKIERKVIIVEALVHQPPKLSKTSAGDLNNAFENQVMAEDMIQEESPDLDIGSEVILIDEDIIEKYIVDEKSGELKGVTTEKCTGKGDVKVPKLKEGTYCVFREEGSLFPGRIQKLRPLQVSVLQKKFLGGWSWPSKADICQIDEANIISVLKEQQLSKKGGQLFIEDEILLLQWGV